MCSLFITLHRYLGHWSQAEGNPLGNPFVFGLFIASQVKTFFPVGVMYFYI